MDHTESSNTKKYSIPMPMDVTSPVKLILESSGSATSSVGAMAQPIIPVKLSQQKQLEPHVCLLPMSTPFPGVNSNTVSSNQGTGASSISSLTMSVPNPLSPVMQKPISSPLVALSTPTSMHISPGSPPKHSKLPSGAIPPSSPTANLHISLSGSSFGQSSHRSRKEKLICRSGADSMEVQSPTPTPNLVIPDEPSNESPVVPKNDATFSPSKTKKPSSPSKGTRPYNRRKTASESTDKKSKDSLSKRVLVSNAHRRVGLSPESNQKRTYKRRNTIATSSILDDPASEMGVNKLSPPKSSGLEMNSAKPKSPDKPKVSVAKGGLSQKEKALLPMLSKYVVPNMGAKSPVTTQTQPAPSPSPIPSIQNEKRLADLRIFGSPNVLPIFKPNQKPWNLLKRLLEGKDADETNTLDNVENIPMDQFTEMAKVVDSDVLIEDDLDLVEDTSDDSEYEETGSESLSGEDVDIEMAERDITDQSTRGCILPVDRQKEDVSFTEEARPLVEQIVVPNPEVGANLPNVLSSRTRTESESSLPGFNIAPSPVSFPRHSSTPVSSNSNSESPFDVNSTGFQFPTPTGQTGDQQNSKSPESYQFKPIQRETPSSPLLGSSSGSYSKWPWTQNGRESPNAVSRYQPPSPSPSTMSGSSANGGSGRRYSRRRHARMYPPFETSHCMYSKHFCSSPLEPGSTYCIKHVSEKYSPYYVRCAFMSNKNGRRCPNMQYSRDGKNKFCNMHASRLALLRQKLYRKPRPTETLKDHFGEMQRLQNKLKKPKRTEAAAYLEDYCDYKLQTQCMENEIEVIDSPEMNLSVEEMSQFQVEHDSDGGCDVQDEYECLKNAGYYTTEEVVRILKSKLSKLKELYLREFDFLKLYYILKRQEYLQAEDKIKHSGVRVSRNPKTLFKWKDLVTEEFIRKEMKTYEKTKALLNYHKLRGQSAVIHHLAKTRYEDLKWKEAREKQYVIDDDDTDSENGTNPVIRDFVARSKSLKDESENFRNHSNCKFDDGIIKCSSVALPSSDFCHRHALQDENQVLFQPCNYPMDNKEFCQNPLLKKLDRGGCDFHRSFRLKRFCKSREEKKSRLKLFRSMPRATFKEHMTMLEDVVTCRFSTVEDFDAEVNYLENKGLDCSDTSNSDYENEYDVQVNEDDEEEPGGDTAAVHKRKRSNSYRKHAENFMKTKDVENCHGLPKDNNLANGESIEITNGESVGNLPTKVEIIARRERNPDIDWKTHSGQINPAGFGINRATNGEKDAVPKSKPYFSQAEVVFNSNIGSDVAPINCKGEASQSSTNDGNSLQHKNTTVFTVAVEDQGSVPTKSETSLSCSSSSNELNHQKVKLGCLDNE